MFRCFCTIFRELWYYVRYSYKILKLLKLNKTVAQILSHSDLLFYVILVIVIKLRKKLPEDDAEAPKRVGAFVI